MDVVTQTSLPLPLFQRGKVRDVYDIGKQLLFVSTDRISAFDVVLPTGVPEKGRVLNQMSAFWFRLTSGLLDNHMVESIDSAAALAALSSTLSRYDALPEYLVGRCMVVKKARRIPVECVIRGYLSGSAWAEYRVHGTVQGKSLPAGLRESEELPQPLFTPTTKSETEHDRPLTERDIVDLNLRDTMPKLQEASLALYSYAAAYARKRGIIIADTKFEFGWLDGALMLIDEALTPDSSRFWAVDVYSPGKPQPSYDKQPVRDWLTASGWNDKLPAPSLPSSVIAETSARYVRILEWLTAATS
jgi:phosphoribosylaminoimidazole-succinocarboxamide synthase